MQQPLQPPLQAQTHSQPAGDQQRQQQKRINPLRPLLHAMRMTVSSFSHIDLCGRSRSIYCKGSTRRDAATGRGLCSLEAMIAMPCGTRPRTLIRKL